MYANESSMSARDESDGVPGRPNVAGECGTALRVPDRAVQHAAKFRLEARVSNLAQKFFECFAEASLVAVENLLGDRLPPNLDELQPFKKSLHPYVDADFKNRSRRNISCPPPWSLSR